MRDLGKRLKWYRKKLGLSIVSCAKAAGVSPSTYREWEYGRSIKGEPYERLAHIFDVSVSELLTGRKVNRLNELEDIEIGLKKLLTHVKNMRILS